jgi:hypothetical protein
VHPVRQKEVGGIARPLRLPRRAATIAFALAFAVTASLGLLAWSRFDEMAAHRPVTVAATPFPIPPPEPPATAFDPIPRSRQAGRLLSLDFRSDRPLSAAEVRLSPEPGVPCQAQLLGADFGRITCAGLLAGATDYVATLTVTSAYARAESSYSFRTVGDRLGGVPWYTEFEDPRADPLACAAASVRIVTHFTTGSDRMTASEILRDGRALNRSRDPGIDPVAIAGMLERLDPGSAYHYYRFADRVEATNALAYWLARSGKPVIAISLGGQHAPVVIGFAGAVGASIADTRVDGLVVLDPQRGDLSPLTNRRPDKYRTAEFQTGKLLAMDEWYGDEWWFRYPYASSVRTPRGFVNIERNDGAYPIPHWAGTFVIVVDDGDRENPFDREGRVPLR